MLEQEYLEALDTVLAKGHEVPDRSGTGIYSYKQGIQLHADISQSFPLLTTKTIYFKSVIAELLWILRGHTNVKELQKDGCHIWDEWADDNGDLGPTYGYQMRKHMSYPYGPTDAITGDSIYDASTKGVDQLSNVIDSLKEDPWSRRHVISLWNPIQMYETALPCCHGLVIQFFFDPGPAGQPSILNCHVYQRSADMFLGVPFNIASYSLMTKLLARQLGCSAGSFTLSIGDAHIYKNHVLAVVEQLRRKPKKPPQLFISKTPDLKTMKWWGGQSLGWYPISMAHFAKKKIGTDKLFIPKDLSKEDELQWKGSPNNVILVDYFPHKHIPAPVAV